MIVLQSNGPGYNDHTQTDKYKAKDAPNVPLENVHKTPRRDVNYRCQTSVCTSLSASTFVEFPASVCELCIGHNQFLGPFIPFF